MKILILFSLILGSFILSGTFASEKNSKVESQKKEYKLKAPHGNLEQMLNGMFDDDYFDNTHRDPFAQMKKMREQMLKHFEQGESDGSNFFDRWYQKKFGGGTINELSQREDNKFVYIDIATQGLDQDKLDIKIEKGQVNISGRMEKKTEDGDAISYTSSSFRRSLPIPTGTDFKKVEIENTKDRVTLKFPKI